ncbi:MAG: cell division protein FtsQ/DivIB [Methylobacter sp.]|uniref:cell division protein FtsQ/DivIB n=1 Tax=Methylobacter sp. TaxID=2051955 RepID=UPI002587AF93|nr:cell division protein FtsQ/DivIB [Methylobacter sp.]MCL7420444.1 cell division protein FtsQ/DivIB [Methylobacter sp.]
MDRQAVKILGAILLIGLIWLCGQGVKSYGSGAMPIKYVRIEGVFQYLGKDEIKTALRPLVMTSFFAADMQAIHEAVAQLPWVQSAAVKRVWPDAIDIKVHEKKPYVRWGQQSLLTERGELFAPKNIEQFQTLPLLVGPDQQHGKVLEIMKGVKTALADQSMELAEFSIDDRWSWKIKLATGMEILLGRNEPLEKLQRFLKTLTVLGQEQIDAMAIVDLRYPNGYGVSWKPGTAEIDWKKLQTPKIKQMGN